ncbi:hypothetical protein RhiirA4_453963 [Rhizophagus irregularis]|uniref:Uncharacterized protein n=1 Tax=Rhizophagus irregularis TaxID=588596 RepID=A0A2I1G1Q6_9GLOM|nr:hypothetical protein RhiirA4_453963 [Rhizophagus irregularis]
MQFYHNTTDHDKLIDEKLLSRSILKYHLSIAWLDSLMKEWKFGWAFEEQKTKIRSGGLLKND